MLLDTSIIIEFFKGNPKVVARLQHENKLTISCFALAELYLGAHRSSNYNKHIGQIRGFLAGCEVLTADAMTAEHYARIKSALLKKGKPIPENDIWIAALAEQYGLSLFTEDSHFNEIETLKLVS